jgi:hypothetical protein
MEKQQNARGIAGGDDRVFPTYAVNINVSQVHVIGYRPNRTHVVETLAALRPPDRSWLGSQQRANGFDFGLSHCLLN